MISIDTHNRKQLAAIMALATYGDPVTEDEDYGWAYIAIPPPPPPPPPPDPAYAWVGHPEIESC